jgi:hypothetical protein
MLIRFCYAPDDPARAWRFDWFRSQVLPRILAQRRAKFDLWLWLNPADRAEIEAMDPRIQTFTVATTGNPAQVRLPWSQVRGLPRYPVQVRIDSDDLIGPDFVATARRQLRQLRPARALVFFQPWKLDVATGRVYESRVYSRRKVSMFLAMRQPVERSDYRWVYGRGHMKMHALVDAVGEIPLGHCWLACHQFNDSTAIRSGDRLVGQLAV